MTEPPPHVDNFDSADMDKLQKYFAAYCANNSDTIDLTTVGANAVVRDVIVCLLDVVGLFGNLLSCIVIKRFLLKTSGTYVLFLFLALSDSLVMVVVTIEILRHAFPVLIPSTDLGCGVHSFFFNFSFELSAWIILALTIERYLTIRSPFAHRERSKIIRRAWIIGVSIVTVLFAINCHLFHTRVAEREEIFFKCGRSQLVKCQIRYNGTLGQRVQQITNYTHAIAYAYLPYAVTLVFNIILLVRLFMTRNYQQNRRTTVMLLLVTFSFIILTLPHAIYTLFISHINHHDHRDVRIPFRDVARVLLVVNHSLNFAFYMTGRQFRSAVHRLFCGALNRRRRSSIRTMSRRLTSAPIVMATLTGRCHSNPQTNNNTRCSEADQTNSGREYMGVMYTPCNHHDFPVAQRNRHCSNNSCL